MPVAGVDVGSVAAKAVILDELTNNVLAHALVPTGWNPRQAGEDALDWACAQAGVDRPALTRVTGTGYGRIALPFADKTVTEITCHALGAVHLFPGTGVVLDIGGQDSKAIAVDADGSVQDFVMNDKSAAGTGRFLQVLSGILGMDVQALDEAAGRGKPADISSMCAVFAETEIVGLLAECSDLWQNAWSRFPDASPVAASTPSQADSPRCRPLRAACPRNSAPPSMWQTILKTQAHSARRSLPRALLRRTHELSQR